MAVEAILEPLRVALTVPPNTATIDNLPGTFPIHLSSASRLLSATPELKINSPMRMNKGRGNKEKFVTERKMLSIVCSRPGPPTQINAAATMFTKRKAQQNAKPEA